MSLDLRFYHAADRVLGGAIDTASPIGDTSVTGVQTASLGALQPPVTSDPATGSDRNYFKKVWIKNHTGAVVAGASLYLSDLSEPNQISFAREKSASDVTTSPYSYPSGYSDPDFLSPKTYASKAPLSPDSSALGIGASKSIWIRTKVPAGSTANPAADLYITLVGFPS